MNAREIMQALLDGKYLTNNTHPNTQFYLFDDSQFLNTCTDGYIGSHLFLDFTSNWQIYSPSKSEEYNKAITATIAAIAQKLESLPVEPNILLQIGKICGEVYKELEK